MSDRGKKGARVRFGRVPAPVDRVSATSHAPVVVGAVVAAVERAAAETVTVDEPTREVQVVVSTAGPEPEETTPIFDALVQDSPYHLFGEQAAEMDRLLAEPFEGWGLDDRAPKPIVTLIEELTDRVGAGRAWEIEKTVGAEVLLQRLTDALDDIEEEEVNGHDDADTGGPAGAAEGAEPGRADLVDGEGGGHPDPQEAG